MTVTPCTVCSSLDKLCGTSMAHQVHRFPALKFSCTVLLTSGVHLCSRMVTVWLLPAQCLPSSPAPSASPAGVSGSTTGSSNPASTPSTPAPTSATPAPVNQDPQQLQKDLTCNCPRAVQAARAVSQALSQAGNNCGSGAGQALARKWSSKG